MMKRRWFVILAAAVVALGTLAAGHPRHAHSASRSYVTVPGEPVLTVVTTATSSNPNQVGSI